MAIPRHDWYLKQWLKTLRVTQQQVADRLEIQKSKVSRKANGVTPYDREDINAISAVLHIEPYELLMHPDEAHQIRRLRQAVEEEHRLRAVGGNADEVPDVREKVTPIRRKKSA